MNKFNKELLKFLKTNTTSFTCIKNIKEELIQNGYQELFEKDNWTINKGKYFVIRNDTSIIAFNINTNFKPQFNIVCTHSDTPCLSVKPNPNYYENNYQKLNIAPYGGILNYGFMDRPLALAGRLILKKDSEFIKTIIDTKEPVAIIPSIAIHQNDKANSKLDLNTQIDLMPIISLNKNFDLNKLLKSKLNINDEIFDYDLYLYNSENPKIINNELLASPRIDNLTCTFASLKAFMNTFNDSINILCVFNSEEIGSNTYEGADSNFLIDTLKRICSSLNINITPALANSLIISADNTHARHPNHNELSDHTNTPPLNSGILITKEMNGTTNSITSTIFKAICESANIPCSYYTSRNDFATGSTLASINLKHLSINSLDVGLAMLAMHSSYELIGLNDTKLLFQALTKFYQIKYNIENNKIKVL